MLNEFMDLLSKAESVLVGEKLQKARVVARTPAGDPSFTVASLAAGEGLTVDLTEEGVSAGRFDDKTKSFLLFDALGAEVNVRLLLNGQALCPPEGFGENKGPHFLVVQEGGSSQELYVHSLFTRAQAHRYQVGAGEDGAYRTSDVIEVPADLAAHPDFYRIAEELVKAAFTLENRATGD